MSLDLGRKVIEEALKLKASYVDVRIGEIFDENLTVRNRVPEEVTSSRSKGMGVRVIANGAWGFAGSVDLTGEGIVETT